MRRRRRSASRRRSRMRLLNCLLVSLCFVTAICLVCREKLHLRPSLQLTTSRIRRIRICTTHKVGNNFSPMVGIRLCSFIVCRTKLNPSSLHWCTQGNILLYVLGVTNPKSVISSPTTYIHMYMSCLRAYKLQVDPSSLQHEFGSVPVYTKIQTPIECMLHCRAASESPCI